MNTDMEIEKVLEIMMNVQGSKSEKEIETIQYQEDFQQAESDVYKMESSFEYSPKEIAEKKKESKKAEEYYLESWNELQEIIKEKNYLQEKISLLDLLNEKEKETEELDKEYGRKDTLYGLMKRAKIHSDEEMELVIYEAKIAENKYLKSRDELLEMRKNIKRFEEQKKESEKIDLTEKEIIKEIDTLETEIEELKEESRNKLGEMHDYQMSFLKHGKEIEFDEMKKKSNEMENKYETIIEQLKDSRKKHYDKCFDLTQLRLKNTNRESF